MFRAKAGSKRNAANVTTVVVAAAHVNRQWLPSGSPKSIETRGAFQFFQHSQPSSPASATPRAVEQARSGRHSFQILNARDGATSSNLRMKTGISAWVSDSSNFI